MKKYLGSAVLVTSGLLFALQLQAATVEIEWQEPETYRDVRPGNESPVMFEERVIKALTGFFEEAAAAQLPADQVLHLKITDVDLAGDVDYFFLNYTQGIRVMRDVFFPSIDFSYELKDASGAVIKSGEENIKDMGYLYSGANFVKNPPFNYEKDMIDDWFRKNFK
jgi:hypothetical protein